MVANLPWIDQLDITVLAIDDNRTDVDEATRAACERLEKTGATVSVCVYAGKPTVRIRRHLDEASPDFVALGTRGLTGLRRLRLGSTASAIARTATCSVLVACDEEHDRTPDNDR